MDRRVGCWELVAEVARGGAGSVWRARDATSGREAALKMLHAASGTSPAQLERFRREAETLARIRHPRLVSILDAGSYQGIPYLAMELVAGESLQDRLDRAGPLEPREAVTIVREVALALAAAHAQGVLHRDLKPGNIILRADGSGPVIVDFGLAFDAAAERTRLTRSGQMLGTPGFWAPEQAKGEVERLGPAVDVWALGATLYALLTGVPPHGAPETLAQALAALEREPEPPSRKRAGIDPALDAVCLRCLRLDPAARFSDMRALADALGSLLGPRAIARASKPGRPIAQLASAVLIVAGLVAGGAIAWPAWQRARARRLLASATELSRQGSASWPLAREQVERALELEPEAAAAWFLRGDLLERAGDLAGAESGYRRAIALDPRHAKAHTNIGLLHQGRGELDLALASLERALAIDPNLVEALNDRGGIHLVRGDPAAALRDSERALALEPDLASAHANRGMALRAMGDLDGAEAALRRALELAPGHAGFHVALGRLLAERADHPGALASFERALALSPEGEPLGNALVGRGAALVALGRPSQALVDLDRAVHHDPQDYAAFSTRASARLSLQDMTGAIADLERAHALQPEHVGILTQLGITRVAAGDQARGEQDLLRAALLAPPGSEEAKRIAAFLGNRTER